MKKPNNQEFQLGLKFVLITISALFLTACAGKPVPEEDRIETTYNFNTISGFNYYEARDANKRNRRNPSGPRDNSALNFINASGKIEIQKNSIILNSEPMSGMYTILSVRKNDMDGNQVRYTYKTDNGDFKVVVNKPSDVHRVSLSINNEDFFQFLVRR
jgi:PBP1b-binding outer membrane lipoprotein LpoB